jgi:hypothetical protein
MVNGCGRKIGKSWRLGVPPPPAPSSVERRRGVVPFCDEPRPPGPGLLRVAPVGGFWSGAGLPRPVKGKRGKREFWWTSRQRKSVIRFMVWLLVRIHRMNQNAFPAHSEGILAARLARATCDSRNGNQCAFFEPPIHDGGWTVRHKV